MTVSMRMMMYAVLTSFASYAGSQLFICHTFPSKEA